MKRLGSVLMAIGLLIGGILGIGVIAGVKVAGVPLLIAIGLGKLTFVGAIGLMGAGAALRRIALRKEQRHSGALGNGKEFHVASSDRYRH
jgi:hypothetical protein